MNFLFPGFLFALFAISIPVVIHLFRFRRFKTVYFPNITFLSQLSEVSDKESRLKHLLVLIARILTIICLVMAFSRPYIPSGEDAVRPEGNTVGVYIDNSFSMEALSGQGPLLDLARTRALEIAGVYGPGDRFLLLTNDFEGRHQRFVSREEFIDMVHQVEPSPQIRSIAEVMTRKEDLFADRGEDNARAYYISDFQKSTIGLYELDFEPVPPAYLIPLQARQTDNVFIDSIWFDSPVVLRDQPVTMGVRVRNDGVQRIENQPLRLFAGTQQRAVVSYSLDPGGEETLELNWSAGSQGVQQAYVQLTDYPVSFDDTFYFTYRVTSEIPVLSIEGDGRNPFTEALFGSHDLFSYRTMPGFSIDYSAFAEYNLIILDASDRISAGLEMELHRFTEAGGSLVIFPGKNPHLPSYNSFLQAAGIDTYSHIDTTAMRVGSLNEMHVLFDGVFEHIPENIDLPRTSKYIAISRTTGSMGEDLMTMQNGLPFFSSYPSGAGRIFLSAVPLDDRFSNFQRHSLFVPIMANIALQSGYVQPLYHITGDDKPAVVTDGHRQADMLYSIRRDGFEVIPEQRRSGNQLQLFFHDQVQEAGNYGLYAGNEQVGGLSFNYDRRESLLEAYESGAIEDMMADRQLTSVRILDAGDKPLDQVLHEMGPGSQLWRLFLLLALLFLLIEVLILRFWK